MTIDRTRYCNKEVLSKAQEKRYCRRLLGHTGKCTPVGKSPQEYTGKR